MEGRLGDHPWCAGVRPFATIRVEAERANEEAVYLTHVRLNMYPDGGIARFRLFGHAVPVLLEDKSAVFDLAAAQASGAATSTLAQKDNLLLPGRGKDMGDG